MQAQPPAWSGFCSAADISMLNNFVNKCKKLYNCKQIDSGTTELFKLADETSTSSLLSNPIYYIPFFRQNHPNHITFDPAVTISY